jgi:hypothetical protein
MTLMSSLTLAVGSWLMGYLYNRFITNPTDYRIISPKWLFYLCGRPDQKNNPAHVLSVFGIQFQLCGYIYLLYNIIFYTISIKNYDGLLGILPSYLFGIIFTQILRKRYPYRFIP